MAGGSTASKWMAGPVGNRPNRHNCKCCLMPLGKDTRSTYMYLFNKLPIRPSRRLLVRVRGVSAEG
jgi:hypothetical protein